MSNAKKVGDKHIGDEQRVAVGLGLAPDVFWLERSRLRDLVEQINASPIDHVVVTDHVAFRGGRGADGITALTLLAGLGIEKPLHTGVLILPLRHPSILARQLLDLADFHEPGVVLGVGVGGDDPDEYTMAGMSVTERGRRMDDSLTMLEELLGPQASIDHSGFHAATGPGLDRRGGRPVSILVGGRADAAHRRAAAADGWVGTFCSASRFAAGRDAVRAITNEPLTSGYQAWVGIGPDGRDHADRVINQFYGMDPAPFRRYTPAGSPAEVHAELVPYVEAGCDLLNLFAASPAPETSVEVISDVAMLLR